jgi:hypothetical protein
MLLAKWLVEYRPEDFPEEIWNNPKEVGKMWCEKKEGLIMNPIDYATLPACSIAIRKSFSSRSLSA